MASPLLQKLRDRLGSSGLLTGNDVGERYASDSSRINATSPVAVLRPASTDEVAFILAACNEEGQPVVVQGGLTGLCGGGTPHEGEFALSLERLSGVEELDRESMTMTVLSGTPLQVIQEAAEAAGFRFPLDLGARGSCTIGGNISTNAGGNEVIRYGMTRALILGLEAVLPDGTVISAMNKMLKNNAGFDLKHLFIGTEGVLGIVTRAVLRLFPSPLSRSAAMCRVRDVPTVIRLLHFLGRNLSGGPSAFELMWPDYVGYITSRVKSVRVPLEQGDDLFVLVEYEGSQPGADQDMFQQVLASAMNEGLVTDAAIATSEKEADQFWQLRDGIAEVLNEVTEGANFDISVPISAMNRLIVALHGELREQFPGIDTLTFGHLGDSNLHLVATTGDRADQKKIFDIVYRRVGEFEGSVSAEHGIGTIKREYLHHSRSAAEIALMKNLKLAMDPNGILNPGRVIPS